MIHRPRPLRLSLFVLLLAFAGSAHAGETLRVVIEFGNEKTKTFEKIAWREGMTALDAMKQAKKADEGITFKYRGKGSRAFLTSIDGVKNEGGGRKGRNWTYRVNGKLAKKSFAARELEADDVLTWKFAPFGK